MKIEALDLIPREEPLVDVTGRNLLTLRRQEDSVDVRRRCAGITADEYRINDAVRGTYPSDFTPRDLYAALNTRKDHEEREWKSCARHDRGC